MRWMIRALIDDKPINFIKKTINTNSSITGLVKFL